MSEHPDSEAPDESEPDRTAGQSAPPAKSNTPGRARDAASRQQRHKDQGLQSGSPELDAEASEGSDVPPVPTIPPGPK